MYSLFHSLHGVAKSVARAFMASVILLAPVSLATAENTELSQFKAALAEKYAMKEKAFADNDPEPILTRFYTADVVSIGPDGDTHIGLEALRPVYEEVIASTVEIEPFRSFVRGNAGWDWVNFHVTPPPQAEMAPFTFKMLFLWERIDGEWWSHGEMYVNSASEATRAAH